MRQVLPIDASIPGWLQVDDEAVRAVSAGEVIVVEAWGRDALRLRCAPVDIVGDDARIQAISHRPSSRLEVSADDAAVEIRNGAVRVRLVDNRSDSSHELRLSISVLDAGGSVLLSDHASHWHASSRTYRSSGVGESGARWDWKPPAGRLYGLGQQHHGRLALNGLTVDLVQRNGEVTIPFLFAEAGFGLLLNSTSRGSVSMAENVFRWDLDAAEQLDIWVCAAGTPAEALDRYSEVVGRPPVAPDWMTGFWQSRLRYANASDVMDVVDGYVDRGLCPSVVVIDYFHWTSMGDYAFDPEAFPDAAGMIEALATAGARTAVSVWPTMHEDSASWDEFRRNGWLLETSDGTGLMLFGDVPHFEPRWLSFWDATNPAAVDAVWARLRTNYLDAGVAVLWLDACEPDIFPEIHHRIRAAGGRGDAVLNAFGRQQARALAERAQADGIELIMLSRSTWAGGGADPVVLWSGDIPSTFEGLAREIPAALNAGLSGIAWWTCDIGGFEGGRWDDPTFRELLVRWAEFAVFLPVMRFHGFREPGSPYTGGMPNEVWSFGEEVEAHLTALIALRETLRPEIGRLLEESTHTGAPVIRPLFWAFPDDDECWTIEDQFLVGNDVLVAPVVTAGAEARVVYLPSGTQWRHAVEGSLHDGGGYVEVPAPLGSPVWFRRVGGSERSG